MTTVAAIAAVLESRFPPALAESWDAVGLVVGDPHAEVTRVLFAVDPVMEVVEEAVDGGAEMIVVHHPLLLKGTTAVPTSDPRGEVIHTLISHGIALYAAHTNADAAAGGVNDALAAAIGVVSTVPLVPDAGDSDQGSGRVGVLNGPLTLGEFAQRVADALPATVQGVRVSGNVDDLVTSVALVGGAGDSYLDAAFAAGVDVFVTADLRHHPASDARARARSSQGRPFLIDLAHYASEWSWLADAAREVGEKARVQTEVSTLSTEPWTARFEPSAPS